MDALNSPVVREITDADRAWATDQFARHFGSADIASRDIWFDTNKLPGFVATRNGRLIGALVHTPMRSGAECEVIALVSAAPCSGAGTALLTACVNAARAADCTRIFLTTSNDNLDAMRFYQKRGWRMVAVHRDSITRARTAKSAIPLTGHHGIVIADELELQYEPVADIEHSTSA